MSIEELKYQLDYLYNTSKLLQAQLNSSSGAEGR